MVHEPKEEYVGNMCAGITKEIYGKYSHIRLELQQPFIPDNNCF